jgi:hypothetical protein
VSSQVRSRALALVACGLAFGAPIAGCGSDSEPGTDIADRDATAPTADTTASAPSTSSEAERAAAKRAARRAAARRAARQRRERQAARAARRERRERLRAERAAATTTETTPAPEPEPEQPAAQVKPKPKPKPVGPASHHVVETATLKLVSKKGINFVQEGTVSGTVAGTMRLDAQLGGKGVQGQFTVTVSDGTLVGSASAALTLNGSVARFNGTATLTKGTGAYAKLVPTQLAFSGTVAADASTSTVKLAGDVRY